MITTVIVLFTITFIVNAIMIKMIIDQKNLAENLKWKIGLNESLIDFLQSDVEKALEQTKNLNSAK